MTQSAFMQPHGEAITADQVDVVPARGGRVAPGTQLLAERLRRGASRPG
jgi:hypothetical protein